MNQVNTSVSSKNKRAHRKSVWLEVLGSMNLAISILVVVGIASIIGTVLKQNEPYTSYIIKFGPFWHEIYLSLGLYDVYSAVWFLILLGFLVLSTSICVYRNTPTMLQEMRQFKLHAKSKSLRSMKHSTEWQLDSKQQTVEQILQKVKLYLAQFGMQLKGESFESHYTLVAKKGAVNRLGYIFTHVGMIVLLLGGLIDGNIGLKIKEWTGQLVVETRDLMAKEVPEISRLSPEDSSSFRGSITLPEGTDTNFAFLNIRDGYLIQELPFSIELKDFRVEHYDSGQPKSFESDLIIHDVEDDGVTKKSFEKTISVNYPLIYKGYAIYQASFGDGGTLLQVTARTFSDYSKNYPFQAEVNKSLVFTKYQEEYKLEFEDFKKFNVNPNQDKSIDKKFVNYGSSIIFKARDESGQAREYMNYMSPIELNGYYYFISGMRKTVSEDYTFYHIPLDGKASLDRFFKFYDLLHDENRITQMATVTVVDSIKADDKENYDLQQKVISAMIQIVGLFRQGGFAAIEHDIQEKVSAEQHQEILNASMSVLKEALQNLYLLILSEEGINIEAGITDQDERFFEDAITAMANFSNYGTPFYLQLNDFIQRDASGLQIARAPGQNIVYFGCVLLIIGIFMMFYVAHQRYWFMVIGDKDSEQFEIIFSGSTNRNEFGFNKQYISFAAQLRELTQGTKNIT